MPSTDPDRFSVTPSPASPGDTLTITYTDTGLPTGTIVIVHLDNGASEDDQTSITMGANGSGSTTWTVPMTGWELVNLNADGSAQHTVTIR